LLINIFIAIKNNTIKFKNVTIAKKFQGTDYAHHKV